MVNYDTEQADTKLGNWLVAHLLSFLLERKMCSLYFILASVFYHCQHKNTACLEALPWNVSPCLSELRAPASRCSSGLLPSTSPVRVAWFCRGTRGANSSASLFLLVRVVKGEGTCRNKNRKHFAESQTNCCLQSSF